MAAKPQSEGEMEPPASERAKLFIGGLSNETREPELREYFGMFGEVKDAVVMTDRLTGNARGFGFVCFVDPEAADTALRKTEHVICGKKVEVKTATPKGAKTQNRQYQSPQQRGWYSSCNGDTNNVDHSSSKKIFIGGLPDSVTQLELKNYFEKYGSVVDSVVMYDNATQRSRGFGFIAFASEESVAMALQHKEHMLNGRMVDVKVAVPKPSNNIVKNRSIGNYHNSISANGNGPVYDSYPGYFYPTYGSYGYHGYYNYYNCYGAAPPSPYFYGGAYGRAYNMNGWHGIHYGSPFGSTSTQPMVVSNMDSPNGGFTSNMSASAGGYEEGGDWE